MALAEVALDILAVDHGSVMIVQVLTPEAQAWVDENVHEPIWMGRGFAVEPRYVRDLMDGMYHDGLNVAEGLA